MQSVLVRANLTPLGWLACLGAGLGLGLGTGMELRVSAAHWPFALAAALQPTSNMIFHARVRV